MDCNRGGWVDLSPLTGCNKGCSVPGHCFHPFFPSSLHGPQCLHPALGTWLCHPHPSWSRNEEKQPGNTEADRGPVKDQAWRAQGPVWTSCRGGPVGARSTPRRREDSHPPSRTSFQPSTSFSIARQSFCLPQRCGTMLKCPSLHPPASTPPHM